MLERYAVPLLLLILGVLLLMMVPVGPNNTAPAARFQRALVLLVLCAILFAVFRLLVRP